MGALPLCARVERRGAVAEISNCGRGDADRQYPREDTEHEVDAAAGRRRRGVMSSENLSNASWKRGAKLGMIATEPAGVVVPCSSQAT